MKSFLFSLLVLSSFFGRSQVSAIVDNQPTSGNNCLGYIGIQYQDVSYNGPYTIMTYWNYDPTPFLLDSITSFSSDTSFSIITPPWTDYQALVLIIDNNGDTSTFYGNLPYYGMNGGFYNCSCSYGTLLGYASGGFPPYTYYFNFGGVIPDSTIVTSSDVIEFDSLPCVFSGSVQIYDSQGCGGIYTHPIDGTCSPVNSSSCQKEVIVTIQEPSDTGVCDGVIDWYIEGVDTTTNHELVINYYGQQPNDTLELLPGQTSGQITGLCFGNVLFQLDKDSACFDNQYGNIIYSPTSTFLSTQNNSSCNSCNNSMNWDFSDYTWDGPYNLFLYNDFTGSNLIQTETFNWSATSGNFDSLCPGDYMLIVVDNNGDSITSYSSILPSNILNLQLDNFTNPSPGNFDGNINVFGTSGTPPYQYSIDNVNWQSTGYFDQLGAGTYMITVMDANGCTDTYTILLEDGLGLSAQQIHIDLYPNPSSGVFTVMVETECNMLLKDMDGRLVDEFKFTGKKLIDISDKSAGTYFVEIFIGDQAIKRMIILQ